MYIHMCVDHYHYHNIIIGIGMTLGSASREQMEKYTQPWDQEVFWRRHHRGGFFFILAILIIIIVVTNVILIVMIVTIFSRQ